MRFLQSALVAGTTVLLVTAAVRADERTTAGDEAVLKGAGIQTDGPALLEFFRQWTLSEDEQVQVAQTVRRLGDVSFHAREKATADLIGRGWIVRKYLHLALEDRDPEIVRRAERCLKAIDGGPGIAPALAAARLLAVRKPDDAAAVVLRFLPFADDEALEEELLTTLAAVGVHDGKPESALTDALKDRRATCRAAAALVVGRLPDLDRRAAVRHLLTDVDGRVRWRAAQGLIDGKDKEAIPALLALVGEAPLSVAYSAEELLCRLAGEQSPQTSLGAGKDENRRQCREAWTGWWRTHGPKLDLAKLALDERLLGMTLIVTLDGPNGRGKVWEIGNDGKMRWEITDVHGPIDARVLPGNRVLIAEYYGQRVTERDWQGKVLWEHKVPRRPISVQRLPNGNTFIGTNLDIQEVTPDGKVAFTHTPTGGSIACAQKLRNGNIVYVTYNGSLVEVDAGGAQVRNFKFTAAAQGLFSVDVLPGGHYLVPLSGANKVVEFDGTGKSVAEVTVQRPNTAMKLPNGNLLISSMSDSRVMEVDRTGKTIWEEKLDGRPFRVRRR
ncbi:MAG: PQQ-binding-like beta-propeller repeat protein [Gemmataceae bacterium]|nr:PQQ-binding-like beta-propeller repeat protein [Gemmataceae bacterium]